MQFLPSSATDHASAAMPIVEQALNAFERSQQDSSFGNTLSSFMEEGREDYTGLPPGFSAHVHESGTIGREEADRLRSALKARGAQDASLETIDQFLAAGGPMTVGRMFAALSGTSRLSSELEGQERLDFQQVMKKLGFTTDEAEELLSLSDKGAGSAIWRKISEKMKGLDQLDMHSEELSALLRGLDVSEGVQKQIQKFLAEGQSATLSRAQLETLLAEAGRELTAKDLAAAGVRSQMRAAMEDALTQAKLDKKADPSSDAKGTRLGDYSESMMRNTVNKKIDAGLGDTAGRDDSGKDAAHREDPGFVREGMGRAERIMAKGTSEAEAAPRPKSKGAEALDRMMQRIDAAGQMQTPQQTNGAQQSPMFETAGSRRQEIFTQVEQGLLNTFSNGGGRLTLQLNPQELGQVNLMLSVHNGEVRATIRAENPESAAALSEQLQQLRTSLEEAGLKVAELDVQTGLRDDSMTWNWNGPDQHNQMRDAEENARMRRLAEIRRDAAPLEAGHAETTPRDRRAGLHIVA